MKTSFSFLLSLMFSFFLQGQAFVTIWETTSDNESITIPTTTGEYDYSVDWGDGNFTENHHGSTSHNYAESGEYEVKILGKFPRIYFNNSGSKDKILSVNQWGEQEWTSMESAFYGCSNLKIQAVDVPNLSQTTSLKAMFRNATQLDNGLENWDVSGISNMFNLFYGATNFNSDITNWDVSSLFEARYMFRNAISFNQDIGNWDVSNVWNMLQMFRGASAFDQNLGNWDISNVTNMTLMLNQANLSVENYDATLMGWAELDVNDDIVFSAGTSEYCIGEFARGILTSISGWIITDGGLEDTCDPEIPDCSALLSPEPGSYNVALDADLLWTDIPDALGYRLSVGTTPEGNEIVNNLDVGNTTTFDPGDFPDQSVIYVSIVAYNDFGDAIGCFDQEFMTLSLNLEDLFITKWEISTAFTNITIPTTLSGYDYIVSWGDGNITENHFGNASHIYYEPGIYEVIIIGDFPRIYFNNSSSSTKIISVEQWGTQKWTSMHSAFQGCNKLVINATEKPDFDQVYSCAEMFKSATSLVDGLAFWNMSGVTDMSDMFSGADSFNEDISNWDVSSVTDMSGMFSFNDAFNRDLSDWSIDKVTDLSSMFYNATAFNGDISGWNVDKVSDMSSMFEGAINFNSDIDSWDVSSVLNMEAMFQNAMSFNSSLDSWDVSSVSNMEAMFYNATNFNVDLNSWDVSGVHTMKSMFENATNFNGNIGDWNVSEVISMYKMFKSASSFNSNIGDWEPTKVNDLRLTFNDATSFNQDIGNWDFNATNLLHMFRGAASFDQDLGDWDISNVTNMKFMFQNANLSIDNYDALLIGWSDQDVESGVVFHAGDSEYCLGENSKTILTNSKGWTITDGGYDDDCDAVFPECTGLIFPEPGSIDVDLSSDLVWSPDPVATGYKLSIGTSSGANDILDEFDVGNVTSYDPGDFPDDAAIFVKIIPYNSIGEAFECNEDEFLTFEPNFNFAFITTWEIINPNSSISIPTTGSGYDFTVFWGDGQFSTNQMGNSTHVYTEPGIYEVMIMGDFPRIYFNNSGGSRYKINSIEQWGSIQWESMASAFEGCTNLVINTNDKPDLSIAKSLNEMFKGASSLTGGLELWDVSSITNMAGMFQGASNFNGDITSWDVSAVNDMSSMFFGASSFNQNIDIWDVSNLLTMESMFQDASNFNQSLNSWKFPKVSDLSYMFSGAENFNGDIGLWDVSNIVSMRGMFSSANSINQDFSSWDFSNVVNMREMFSGAIDMTQDLSSWDVSNVVNMREMFNGAINIDQDFTSWDVSNAVTMEDMFKNVKLSLDNYDALLSAWNELDLKFGVDFHAGDSEYCLSELARSEIVDQFNWDIDDGGLNCNFDCNFSVNDDFENGWGNWVDGGADATRANNELYANSGTYSLLIKDNTTSSVITTEEIDAEIVDYIELSFNFISTGFNDSSQDFWLQKSTDGGLTFTTIREWVYSIDFENDVRFFENEIIAGPFSNETHFRFRCDATGNNDKIYLDDIFMMSCPEVDFNCENFDFNDIETDWGIWNDGGDDAARVGDQVYANSGRYTLMIKDNTTTSNITTNDLGFSTTDELNLDFNFLATGFNNSTQDFWLQLSTDGGLTFTTIYDWIYTNDFENDIRVFENINIVGPFTDETQLRFQCDATGNSDKVYFDDISIETCEVTASISNPEIEIRNMQAGLDFVVYPNPTSETNQIKLNINSHSEYVNLKIVDIVGQVRMGQRIHEEVYNVVNLSKLQLESGTYFISVDDGNEVKVEKLIVVK